MVFVAFLRAINLGRVNKVPMAALRVALTDAGFEDVTTHLQSGNVILGSGKRSPAAVGTAIEQLVRAEFGVESVVVVTGPPPSSRRSSGATRSLGKVRRRRSSTWPF